PGVAEPGGIAVTQADLDGDGDTDLVYADANASHLTVFWKTGPGTFDPTPTIVGGPSSTVFPLAVRAADLDGDGDLDLVSANADTQSSSTLTVFWQTAPGVFNPVPTTLGGPSVSPGAWSVQAADLDGDGDLDLVSANQYGHSLTVFWQ